jgi:hypothetical protein
MFDDLPDWRDETKYPATASMERWAWEFLRRNREYRMEWATYIKAARLAAGNDVLKLLARTAYENDFARRFGIAFPCDPRCEKPNIRSMPAETDSWTDLFSHVHFKNVFAFQPIFKGSLFPPRPRLGEKSNDHLIMLAIDARFPWRTIAPQIKKYIARESERRITEGLFTPISLRAQRRLYCNYLRVLDAVAQGAKPKDIAATLKAPQTGRLKKLARKSQALTAKDIARWRATAEKLRDGGYLGLPALSSSM